MNSPNATAKSTDGSGKVELPEKLIAGSKHCPYKLAVVGGGPSGCSVIIRAFRIGFGGELCGFCTRKPALDKDGKNILADAQYPFQSAGVCLVDEGTNDRFGGGKLQDYIINANTWANKFVTNVMDDKPEVLPQESVSGTPFQRLGAQSTAVTLKGYGCKPAPLPMVGAFLRDAGAVVQDCLNNKYPESSRCMLETKVTGLQQVMLPVPAKYQHDLPSADSQVGSVLGWKMSLEQKSPGAPNGKMYREIYAHKVVLATGGRQELPRLPNPAHTRKLMSSDYVCTQKGLDELRSRLVKAGLAANRTTPGRVVVIGGSHSAFSAAWLCLHRLNEPASGTSGVGSNATTTGTGTSAAESKSSAATDDPTAVAFCQSGICIVHKSSIKVFYSTKADADKDGYVIEGLAGSTTTPGNTPGGGASQVSKSWIRGQIHPFGGIRGDAKDLWRAARDGREPRVKVIQVRQNVTTVAPGGTGLGANGQPTKQLAIVDKLFDEAVVIVWACGYNTNMSMPVLDLNGVPISMRVKCGQVEVDDNARIISASPVVGVAPAVATVSAPPAMPAASIVMTAASPAATAASLLPALDTALDSEGVEEEKALTESDGDAPQSPTKLSVLPPAGSSRASPVTIVPGAATVAGSSAPIVPASPSSTLAPAAFSMSPPFVARTSSFIVKPAATAAPVVEGLLGSGLGFGLQALLENGQPDGSSGRADGVAVYLKRGATLVLAQVLGSRVFGGPDIKSWEDRLKLIKKLQLVANANSIKATEGGPNVASSLDTGSSLLGSPSSKRPSTTAGVRNSFSGVGFTSPASGKETPKAAGSGVLKRAITSKESAAEKPTTCASPKPSASAAPTPARGAEFPFPQMPFEQGNNAPASPVRPATAFAASPTKTVSPTGSPGRGGPLSPKSAITLLQHSPEAQRCAELVDKVALLSADLEHLQLQGAREFLGVSTDAASKTATTIKPTQNPVAVPAAANTVRTRSPSPAAVPRNPNKSITPASAAATAPTLAKPPTHSRASSTNRGGAGENRTSKVPDKTAAAAVVLVPKPTASARVVLTPLVMDPQKKSNSSTPSGSGSGSSRVTPRVVRANSGSASSTGSTLSSPRARPPNKQIAGINSATTATAAAVAPAPVLRSNSLSAGQIDAVKVQAASPRSISKGRANAAPVVSATAVIAPKRAPLLVNTKNVTLELPSIPLNKRSQNQSDDPPRQRAGSLMKDPGQAAEKLGSPGPSSGKISVVV